MNNTVLLNKSAIYRRNNFIRVGKFRNDNLYMGIDKLSFISNIESKIEYLEICRKLDFLTKEKNQECKVKKIKKSSLEKYYRKHIKINHSDDKEFYFFISYNSLRNKKSQTVRFELSPQYAKIDSIYNIVEWLKNGIGNETVNKLFKRSQVTRLDITIDIYSKKFITDYYFSIAKARTGIRFMANQDDLKHNYCVGSNRSNFYLLVYEKAKLYTSKYYKENLIHISKKDIEKHITRLELRIKPKDKDKKYQLSALSRLKNPFDIINIYDEKLIRNNLYGFLPFLQQERSLPVAIERYLEKQSGSSRYNRIALNKILKKSESKAQLDINWAKWQDIVRVLRPFYTE